MCVFQVIWAEAAGAGLKHFLPRYVKIVGHGNSANLWNSITEVRINTLGGSTESGSGSSTSGNTAAQETGIVTLQKQGTAFAMDGNNGSIVGQQVYLWDTNTENVNQQWVENALSGGYYAYRKNKTSLCLDGGEGAARRQPVTLQPCDVDNMNQHWKKVTLSNGSF